MPGEMSGLKITNITRGIWGFFSIFIYIETPLPFEMPVLEGRQRAAGVMYGVALCLFFDTV